MPGLSRTSITAEVWEAINEGWMMLERHAGAAGARSQSRRGPVQRSAARRRWCAGAIDGSMLRNEIYHFARVGTFIERADNTARILDVKYYLLLPSLSYVGSSLDTGQWDSVLRSLSARARLSLAQRRADRCARDRRIPDPRRSIPAQPRLLLRCAARPIWRSLLRCMGSESQCHTLMREAEAKLANATIDPIFDTGLHEFLVELHCRQPGDRQAISDDYRFDA